MSEWTQVQKSVRTRKMIRSSFRYAGIDDYTPAPAQDPDSFQSLHNVITGVEGGRIKRRWGTTLFSTTSINARRIFETHFVNGRNRFILTASDGSGANGPDNTVIAIDPNGSVITASPIVTPSAGAESMELSTSRNYVMFSDGIMEDLKTWNTEDDPTGSVVSTETSISIPNVTNNGISAPADPLAAVETAEGTGSIFLSGGRSYTVVFRNSVKGHASDIGPFFSDALGVTSDPEDETTGVTIELSDIPISSDPQVDQRVILATADGGAQDTLYEVAILNDNTTTTFTDEKSEDELRNSNIWAESIDGFVFGVIGNTPIFEVAPTTTVSCVHRGRVYYGQGHFIFFSKTLAEVSTSTNNVTGRWEEAVPIENQTSVASDGSEVVTALMSDGINLYIGTNRAVYAISGDEHPGLAPPRKIYHEAGVINNAVWRTVFHEGEAVGAIWMTPDRRIIHTNFMSYRDIGHPIQTELTSLIAAGASPSTPTATFVADGPHEFYIFAPGDVHLSYWAFIYNVTTQRWFFWFNTDTDDDIQAVGYMYDAANQRPLPIFSTINGRLYRWNKDTIYDRSDEDALLPLPAIQTNWMDFGDPSSQKVLNSIEVQTDEEDLTIWVEGAMSEADFEAAGYDITLSQRILGTVAQSLFTNLDGVLICPVSHLATRHRYYKFTLGGITDSTETNFLSYMAIEYAPLKY